MVRAARALYVADMFLLQIPWHLVCETTVDVQKKILSTKSYRQQMMLTHIKQIIKKIEIK